MSLFERTCCGSMSGRLVCSSGSMRGGDCGGVRYEAELSAGGRAGLDRACLLRWAPAVRLPGEADHDQAATGGLRWWFGRCTSLMIRCSKPGPTTSCWPSSAATSLRKASRFETGMGLAACISRAKSWSVSRNRSGRVGSQQAPRKTGECCNRDLLDLNGEATSFKKSRRDHHRQREAILSPRSKFSAHTLLLLHHKILCRECLALCAEQQGHRGRVLTKAAIRRRRMVAIELGM